MSVKQTLVTLRTAEWQEPDSVASGPKQKTMLFMMSFLVCKLPAEVQLRRDFNG